MPTTSLVWRARKKVNCLFLIQVINRKKFKADIVCTYIPCDVFMHKPCRWIILKNACDNFVLNEYGDGFSSPSADS